MKRKRKWAVIVLPLILTAALLIGADALADEIKSGNVVNLYRDSYLYDAETGDVIKIRNGMRVTPGDFVATEGNATLVIDFYGDRIYVSPGSVVEVLRLEGEGMDDGGDAPKYKDSTVIKFYRGGLYLYVKRSSDSPFVVKTKTSSIEAKKAKFSVAEVVTEIPRDDPTWEIYLKEVAKPDDDPGRFRVIAYDVKTVVVKGSVTVTSSLEEGPPVEVKKGEKYTTTESVYYRFGE
jgi:hypothetical protein